MRHPKIPASEQRFVQHVRQLEERLFPNQFHSDKPSFMKSDARRFWHFRPSHHVATGLLTQADIAFLKQPGKRLLSIGAHPAFFERLLPELGVPLEDILVADKDPDLSRVAGPLQTVIFDMLEPWPEMGTFDRIIFPESLCIAISDRMRCHGERSEPRHREFSNVTLRSAQGDNRSDTSYEDDPMETELLTAVMRQALRILRTGGIIRANGPMSHPNVVTAMSEILRVEGVEHEVEYQRFLLSLRMPAAVH